MIQPLEVKPRLRGVLHQWAAVVALVAGVVLVALSPSARVAAPAAVFAVSLVVLFTVSATYHRVTWSDVARARMRRLDHSSIFVLIAGTYTPVALLALPPQTAYKLIAVAWGAALIGVLQSLLWVHAPKFVTALLAVAVGWAAIPYSGAIRAALTTGQLALILGGGIAYTLGAVAYAARRPNPVPGVFGYHEVFHALTIVAAAMHFVAVLQLVRG